MAKNFRHRILEAFWRADTKSLVTPSVEKVEIAEMAKSPAQEGIMSALARTKVLGGRQTQPTNFNPFAAASGFTHGYFWLPKKNPQQVDIQDLDVFQWSPGGMLNILADVSPEVSQALWNKLRMIGTKVTLKAVSPDGKEDGRGQKFVDEAISRVNQYFGGIDNVIATMVFGIYCWGACATDSEILPDLRGTGDLFVVNPDTIYFERDMNQFPRPYQLQYLWGMNLPQLYEGSDHVTLPFREMNLASFTYTPFDPGIDDPYGRSPVWPALQVIFFGAQLFRDLQRVVENQAWPHTDFSLQSEILTTLMQRVSANELNSASKLADFIQARISEVEDKYRTLEPRDAFVHPDYLQVTQDTKGADLTGIEKIIKSVQREIVTALKEIPLFMNVEDDSSAETAANQFEMYVHGVERYREIIAYHLKRHCILNAFLNGYTDLKIVASWESIRSTQRLSDAQAERVEIGNEQMKRDNGWQDNDQASLRITGTKAVKEPDWEHLVSQKQGGTGEVPAGKDKNTSQKAPKGSTQSKNARDFVSGNPQSQVLFPETISGQCSFQGCSKTALPDDNYCEEHEELMSGRTFQQYQVVLEQAENLQKSQEALVATIKREASIEDARQQRQQAEKDTSKDTLIELLKASAARKIDIHVPAPVVNITTPDINIPVPVVHISTPAPEVIVNTSAPERQEPAPVPVQTVTNFIRDEAGDITGKQETFLYDKA